MENICSSKNHIILILLTSLRSHRIHIKHPLVMSLSMGVSMVQQVILSLANLGSSLAAIPKFYFPSLLSSSMEAVGV